MSMHLFSLDFVVLIQSLQSLPIEISSIIFALPKLPISAWSISRLSIFSYSIFSSPKFTLLPNKSVHLKYVTISCPFFPLY